MTEIPLDRIRPNPAPAPPAVRRGRARSARREHPRARRPPAHPRDRDPRRLPARRRRAAVPGQPAGRPRAHPGRHPPARRSRAARGRPRREPPAGGSRSDGGGRTRTGRWSTSSSSPTSEIAPRVGRAQVDDHEHAAAARPRPARPGRPRRGPLTRGPRPGDRRACPSSSRPGSRRTVIDQGSRSARPRSSSGACASRASPRRARARRRLDPDLERVEDDLRRRLGTKVTLARSRKGGRIIIEFYSDEELGQLYDRLIGGPA